jgi:hypothetical protein
MPARTPQQIFQHHAEALGAEDIDGVVADYSDDAFFMTPAGCFEVRRVSGAYLRNCSRTYPRPSGTSKRNFMKMTSCFSSGRPIPPRARSTTASTHSYSRTVLSGPRQCATQCRGSEFQFRFLT